MNKLDLINYVFDDSNPNNLIDEEREIIVNLILKDIIHAIQLETGVKEISPELEQKLFDNLTKLSKASQDYTLEIVKLFF